MRRSVYRELTTCLLADCRAAVSEFATSHHNRGVFAFALDCDPFHGALTIGINTKEGFAAVLREKYPKARPAEIEGLHGIRFRCADFAFNDFGLSEETLQLLDEIAATQHDAKTDRTAERHADMLMLTLARVVLILEPDFAKLDQDDDFVAFVTEEGASEKGRIALIRRTVHEDLFDRVFPEVRAFDETLDRVSKLPAEKQAKFWINAARDLACEVESADTERFRITGRTVDTMLGASIEFGSVSVSPLIDALEKTALEPQLHGPKSKAFRTEGPNTPTAAFSLKAIDCIRAIRLVDEDNLARIAKLLGKLLQRDKGKKGGPVTVELARLLHETRPHVFPEAEVDERAMLLRNAQEFGPQ